MPTDPIVWQQHLAQIQALKNELGAVKSAALNSNKRAKKIDKHDEMVGVIKKAIKYHVFKTFKLITDDDGETRLAEAVMEWIDIAGYKGDGDAVRVKRNGFMASCPQVCTQILNDHRNYTQSSVKDVCYRYMVEEKVYGLPALADILQCALRKLDLEDDDKLENALWYVDRLLPKFTGTKREFNHEIRYYQTISKAKLNKTGDLPDITPETEAFGYLLYENNFKKWIKLNKLEDDHPNKSGKTQVLTKKKDGFVEKDEYRYFYVSEHEDLGTPYTNPDAGQQQFGGWNRKGILRYIELVKNIRKARESRDGKKWEKALLDKLREEKGITANNHADQQKLDGRKKSPSTPKFATGVSAKQLFDYEESESEEPADLAPLYG